MAAETRTRILIGAESFADAESAMALARILADQVTADLEGLFVTDAALASLMTLPERRVISAGGRLLQAPSLDQFRAALAGDIRAFRKELAEIAGHGSGSWHFETQSGDFMDVIEKAASQCDILVLGHRTFHRHLGDVLVIDQTAEPEPTTQTLAETLARALRTNMRHVAVSSKQEGTKTSTSDQAGLFASPDALLSHINRLNAAAIVLNLKVGARRGLRDLTELLRVARCPVVVLGLSRNETDAAEAASQASGGA